MSELKINKYFLETPDADATKLDFSIIGLLKKHWKFDKGFRIVRNYSDVDDPTDVVVRIRRNFEFSNDGQVNKIFKIVEWINEDETVGHAETEEVLKTKGQMKAFNREIRQSRIDFLEESAIGTPIEPFVTALIKRYKLYEVAVQNQDGTKSHIYQNLIQMYIEDNFNDFHEAILTEADTKYLAYLNIVVEAPSQKYPKGKTVRDSILYQIA